MSDNNDRDPFATPQPSQPHAVPPPPPPMPQPGMGDYVPPPQPGMGDYAAPPPPSPYGYGVPAPAGSSDKNVLGILALIFPFIGLSLVGIIVGHLGLSAVKKGTANNRGVALAGTIISWVFTVLSVGLLISLIAFSVFAVQQETAAVSWDDTVVAQDQTEDSDLDPQATLPSDGSDSGPVVAFEDLRLGDCVADPYASAVEDPDGSTWLEGIVLVDCAQAHYGEVYAIGDVAADTYIEDDIYALSDDLCYFAFEDYMGVSYEDSLYYYEPFYPTSTSWKFGDREATCIVTSYESDTVGSLRGSGL